MFLSTLLVLYQLVFKLKRTACLTETVNIWDGYERRERYGGRERKLEHVYANGSNNLKPGGE